MNVKRYNGEEHDYYRFVLFMTYYMTENRPHMLYGVLGRRKVEFGEIVEDLLMDFSTPEEAAIYHHELKKQLEEEHTALLERVDQMLEEDEKDMETIPFAPSSSTLEHEQEVMDPWENACAKILEKDFLPFPEVGEEAHADTEVCSSS